MGWNEGNALPMCVGLDGDLARNAELSLSSLNFLVAVFTHSLSPIQETQQRKKEKDDKWDMYVDDLGGGGRGEGQCSTVTEGQNSEEGWQEEGSEQNVVQKYMLNINTLQIQQIAFNFK